MKIIVLLLRLIASIILLILGWPVYIVAFLSWDSDIVDLYNDMLHKIWEKKQF